MMVSLDNFGEWEEVNVGAVPKRFRKEIPVCETVKKFILRGDSETLIVSREFSLCYGNMLNIKYEGRKYIERLIICGGKITYADTLLVEKMVDLPADPLQEGGEEQLRQFFSDGDARLRVKTYHNIKRFRERLLELPWQDDLRAVYDGRGYVLE